MASSKQLTGNLQTNRVNLRPMTAAMGEKKQEENKKKIK